MTKEDAGMMNEIHKYNVATSIDDLILYCRHVEKEFIEMDGDRSGVEVLDEVLRKGEANMALYIQVREAVLDYKRPYTIK